MLSVSSSFTHQLLSLTLSLVVVSHSPVTAAAAAATVLNETLHIGYFMSTDPYRPAAINMAIDRAHDEGILSRYNLRYARARLTPNIGRMLLLLLHLHL